MMLGKIHHRVLKKYFLIIKKYSHMKRIDFIKKIFSSGALMFLPLGLFKFSKEKKNAELLRFHVRGFQYYDGPDMMERMKAGEELSLLREPENKFDKHAIAVYYRQRKIGFVPREKNEVLSRLMDNKTGNLSAEINQIRNDDVSWNEVSAVIYFMSDVQMAA